MNINEFRKEYEEAKEYIDYNEMLEIMRNSYMTIKNNEVGCGNLIIAMEEFSELNIELVKYISKPSGIVSITLIEELSDALFGINYLLDILGSNIGKNKPNPTCAYKSEIINETIIKNCLLQQEISKFLRGKSSKDVLISLALTTKSTIENVIYCLNIKEQQINKATNVKINRQKQRNCKTNL